MTGDTSQKFIARNRAPRVQIEYDVELYDAEKKVQLPFVMGIMADLSGKSHLEPPAVADRKFLDIDVDNFDERMRAVAPRVSFSVPNTLTGEGNLAVDITFESMADFSPGAIARKVDALRPLLEARQQLSDLMAYMDGKAGAEALVERILADPALLGAVSAAAAGDAHAAALDSLRALAPEEDPAPDPTDAVLAALLTSPAAAEPAPDRGAAVLAALRMAVPAEAPDDDEAAGVLDALRADAPDDAPAGDAASDVLASLRSQTPEEAGDDPTAAALASLAAAAPQETAPKDATAAALASLAALDLPEDGGDDGTDDLLAGLAAAAPQETAPKDATADLLAGLAAAAPQETAPPDTTDDLLAGLAAAAPQEDDAGPGDLDDLLGGLDEPAGEPQGDDAGPGDLDDLLGDLDLGGDAMTGDEPASGGEDLDDLLSGPGGDPAAGPQTATLSDRPDFAFGRLGAERPASAKLNRRRFRLAILGDFSGRSARGLMETGEALAARRAILLDPDTAETVIEGFATDLVLPIGSDGAGMAVRLKGIDSLHPDELYETVAIFAELAGLRRQLSGGSTGANAAQRLRDWGAKFGTPVAPPRTRSAGNAVPANLKLSDFQNLIGDTGGALTRASPIDDLMARIVGPHIRAVPDANAQAMQQAVDAALSSAMRMLLHHPEFQSVEAQWRSLDLIARSIETDDTLDVMLYDISAEEIAADLASAGDLGDSGLARLLTGAPLDPETGRGGYSALIGLYSFEETPPHADLLGRIARVAAHVDAPFIAAISPAFLEIAKPDRHPLVARAWDDLRAMPEARHLGLATPRFLLRRPYGARSEPIDAFAFEEFTMSEGMKGMLWANPAVLVAILLARSFRRNGAAMQLGSIMSLGEMPYHFVLDRYGDQVAMPCTERNLTLDKIEIAMARGFMAVASVKGRDEVRLTSFQSLAGGDILGPWAGVAPPAPSAPRPVATAAARADDADGTTDAGDSDLDDLLAGFGDDLDLGGGDAGDIDADLAALLDDL